MAVTDAAIRSAILDVLRRRSAGATACPSDVARAAADQSDWRALMPRVRAVAAELAREGRIRITQGGEAVNPDEAKGPIRLGLR